MTGSRAEPREMEVLIRRGRRTDYEPLAALGSWPGVGESSRRSIRMFRRVVADLGTDLYVAEEGGEVIGFFVVSYARVLALGGQRANLDELVVREDRRRSGVGRRLLEHAQRRATKRSVEVLRAFPADEPARGLLAHAGFHDTGMFWEWRPEAIG